MIPNQKQYLIACLVFFWL